MAKITRPKLSKGTKLGVQHWNQPMQAVAGLLNNATIDSENLELNNTNFSITYNWPRLPSYAFEYQSERRPITIGDAIYSSSASGFLVFGFGW
jgi:hypothetical protein